MLFSYYAFWNRNIKSEMQMVTIRVFCLVFQDDIKDPINDRLTLAERNERLQNQLKSLKEDLAHTRDETGETTMDRIHKENVRQGRDKYKTLREVRKGNTKRRVDQFENM